MAAPKLHIKAIRRAARLALVSALGIGSVAFAQSGLDYRSIGTASTVFYNGPSEHARKIAVVSRYYPVEVLINSPEWLKVRDSSGELAWVESKNVSARRVVMVIASSTQMRQKPDASAAVVAILARNVVLEFLESTPGWVKVKHRDGVTGYVAIAEIWGA